MTAQDAAAQAQDTARSGHDTANFIITTQADQGMSADARGDLFIADTGNSVIREITTSGIIKTVAGLRKTKLRGLPKVDWSFTFAAAAYNLVRAPKLIAATT